VEDIMSAAPAENYHRGTHLLLVHCAALDSAKPTAFARLESSIGKELARLLVYALVGRPGRQGRRGSSSP
jgi:hypothetical protein